MAHRRDDRYAGNWYVKNGRLVVKRHCAGYYEHETGGKAFGPNNKFTRFTITQFSQHAVDGQRNGSAGLWTYYREGGSPDVIFMTKAEAVRELQVELYGAASLDADENI